MTFRVYLVGGDSAASEALADMLTEAGHAVVGTASDIFAAKTLLPRNPERPDVVLVDLDRPRPADPAEADGIRDAAGDPPSLVFLTHPTDVAACRRLAAGSGIPLFRPFEPDDLRLAVDKAAQLKDEFLANMSHELRTPLTAVLGMTEALQDQVYGPLNEKQLHSLEIIERAGNHLLALINDILDISKIEAGKLELEVTPVSVPEICESSLRMVRAPAEKKGITLYSRFNGQAETILADQRRLKQILVNLLSNAVKFTPEGGMVTLTVEDRTEPERVCFRVRDTGIGIEPEAREQIFEPFTQVDGGFARSQDGTGLGLALVRRLVHLHGGKISPEKRGGGGSTFTVALPGERAKL